MSMGKGQKWAKQSFMLVAVVRSGSSQIGNLLSTPLYANICVHVSHFHTFSAYV